LFFISFYFVSFAFVCEKGGGYAGHGGEKIVAKKWLPAARIG
jgi:hypothetical protein